MWDLLRKGLIMNSGSKKITATREIREGLCLGCIAYIVQNPDTYP